MVSDRTGSGEGSPLRIEIHRDVAVRGLNAGMSEPVTNGDEVDAGLKEMDGGAVAHDMGMNPLEGESRSRGLGKFGVFVQEVSDSETGERLAALIPEDPLRRVRIKTQLVDERPQLVAGLGPQGTEAFLAALPYEANP